MSSSSCSPVHELIAPMPRTGVWVAVRICASTLRTEPARICPLPFLPAFHLSLGCQFREQQGSWQASESMFRASAPSSAALFGKPPFDLEATVMTPLPLSECLPCASCSSKGLCALAELLLIAL